MQEMIFFLLILTSVIYISFPLIIKGKINKSKDKRYLPSINGHLNRLWLQKEQIYDSLKDLEMDYETGKISQVDYEEMKTNYKTEAISILKAIDIEKGIKPSKINKQKPSRTAKKTAHGKTVFCPECGTKNLQTYKFCLNCGFKLSVIFSKN